MSAADPVAGWREELRRLLIAIQYFTRLPVPAWVGHDAAALNGAVRYFPAIGLAVGAAGAGVLWAASLLLPLFIAVLLSVVVTVSLTGAFHEDGLADTVDGLGGGLTRARALEIMKDSRVGTFGALALVLVLLLKVQSLAALPLEVAMAGLIAAHALSRWCAVLLIWRLDYVRTEAKPGEGEAVDGRGVAVGSRAKAVVDGVRGIDLVFATVFGLLPLALCGLRALVGLAAALIVLAWLGRLFRRRLGGYTGDTLGAAQQITEVTFYLALLAAWNSF